MKLRVLKREDMFDVYLEVIKLRKGVIWWDDVMYLDWDLVDRFKTKKSAMQCVKKMQQKSQREEGVVIYEK